MAALRLVLLPIRASRGFYAANLLQCLLLSLLVDESFSLSDQPMNMPEQRYHRASSKGVGNPASLGRNDTVQCQPVRRVCFSCARDKSALISELSSFLAALHLLMVEIKNKTGCFQIVTG